jgi:hypothetical protein
MMPFMQNDEPMMEEGNVEDGGHAHPSYEARLKKLEDAVFGQQQEEGMDEAPAQPQSAPAPKKKASAFYGG